jgi:hypothetical protein
VGRGGPRGASRMRRGGAGGAGGVLGPGSREVGIPSAQRRSRLWSLLRLRVSASLRARSERSSAQSFAITPHSASTMVLAMAITSATPIIAHTAKPAPAVAAQRGGGTLGGDAALPVAECWLLHALVRSRG